MSTSNSSCCTLSELNNLKIKKGALSVFHLSIASIGLHFDEIPILLTSSNINFDFIGISEAGFKGGQKPFQNIDTEGYNHIDCTTESNKGETRIYVAIKRDFSTQTRPKNI